MEINKTSPYAVFKIKDFRVFITARFLLTLSVQMQSVVVGWQVYEYTKSAMALGLVGLAEAIPAIISAFFAGHVADNFRRKNVIVLTVTLYWVAVLGLLFLSFNFDDFMNVWGIIPLYILIAITGITRSFVYPAIIATIGQIVPKDLYTNSSTWNSLLWHTATISGPAAGGLIYGFFNAVTSYCVIAVCLLISLLLFLSMTSRPKPVSLKKETFIQSFKTGLRFVFSNQIIVGAMALDMFAVLFGGAVALLPIFASDVLHVGPQGLGFLRAAPAFGAVIMSLILAYYPPVANSGKKLFLSVAGFGISIILFALSENYILSFSLLFLSGAFDNISVIIRQTILQICTNDSIRGRVAAVNSIFIGSSNEIGAFESGLAASIMGTIPSVIFGGCMTIVVLFVAAKKVPKLLSFQIKDF